MSAISCWPAIVGFTLALSVAAHGRGVQVDCPNGGVKIPSVRGKTFSQARAMVVAQTGLEPSRIELIERPPARRLAGDVKPGHVMQTNPRGGTVVCDITVIQVYVRELLPVVDADRQTLPSVEGDSFADAKKKLSAARIESARWRLSACGRSLPSGLPGLCESHFKVHQQWPPAGHRIGRTDAVPLRLVYAPGSSAESCPLTPAAGSAADAFTCEPTEKFVQTEWVYVDRPISTERTNTIALAGAGAAGVGLGMASMGAARRRRHHSGTAADPGKVSPVAADDRILVRVTPDVPRSPQPT